MGMHPKDYCATSRRVHFATGRSMATSEFIDHLNDFMLFTKDLKKQSVIMLRHSKRQPYKWIDWWKVKLCMITWQTMVPVGFSQPLVQLRVLFTLPQLRFTHVYANTMACACLYTPRRVYALLMFMQTPWRVLAYIESFSWLFSWTPTIICRASER